MKMKKKKVVPITVALLLACIFLLPSCQNGKTEKETEEKKVTTEASQKDKTEPSEKQTDLPAERSAETKESDPSPKFEPQNKEETVTEPAFIVENVTCSKGEHRVAVSIRIKNNPGISAVAVTPVFDTTELKLVDYVVSEEKGGQSVSFNPEVSQPKIIWLHWDGNVSGDWTFATLYFDVAETATPGKKSISLSYNADDVYNFKEDNVNFAIIGGSVMVG